MTTTTPFEKYLQESDYPGPPLGYSDDDDHHHHHHPVPREYAYGRVEIQLPQFMYTGPPALAHGGGAEVLPVGTFNHTDSFAASWFANTTGLSPDAAYLSSSFRAYGALALAPVSSVPGPVPPGPALGPGPAPRPGSGPGSEALGGQRHFDAHHSDAVSHLPPPPLPPPIGADLNDGYYLDYYYYTDARKEEEEEAAAAAAEAEAKAAEAEEEASGPALGPAILGVSIGSIGSGGGGASYYSSSGFDVLSLLARVATRPRPRVYLGPVDLTCAFVVVDVRRHDAPIVYCSPMFCRLTGYAEGEVLGRNCRFLQSPTGQVGRGEVRRYTSEGAVAYLKRQLAADKECQTRIVNYRKGGAPFVNLLTVIPVPPPLGWEDGEEVVYHVGFQVDLSEQNVWRMQQHQQPHVLLLPPPPPVVPPVQLGQLGLGLGLGPSGATSMKKLSAVGHQPFISKTLKKLLADTEFVRSIPISSATTVPVAGCGGTAAAATTTTTTTTTTTAVVVVDSSSSSTKANNSASEGGGDRSSSSSSSWLSLMLLETCPDFVHVVSLKGSFLYVGPSVRRVLGYEPEEMVGGSIADLAHPEDVVPLMRELKESSSTGGGGGGGGGGGVGASTLLFGQEEQTHASMAPRTVDLLFRARTKGGVYVWVECRGRLFVEPGKGRKAIILSGRAREMPRLGWETVCMRPFWGRREFWCLVGGQGTFVAVGSGVKEVLGWNGCELVGRRVGSVVEEWRDEEGSWPGTTTTTTMSRLRRADGGSELGRVVVYHSLLSKSQTNSSISPWPLICQIQLGDGSGRVLPPPPPPPPLLQREGNVFAELETSRGSSWQYELQQLRFANQRLGEAVRRVGPVSMKRSWESMVTTT